MLSVRWLNAEIPWELDEKIIHVSHISISFLPRSLHPYLRMFQENTY